MNEAPEPPVDPAYVDRLEWALVNIMSGMTARDIRGETGMDDESCDRIEAIRREAVRRSWAKVARQQEKTGE